VPRQATGALAASRQGLRFFGHWMRDDLTTALVMHDWAPLVAPKREPTLHQRDYLAALQLDITPAQNGHLYIALAGSDGKSLYLLYPNELAKDNRVRAGQRVSLPGPGWEVVAGGPAGTETLLVMVTDAPRDLSALGQEKAGPFMKTLLDADGRARLQWILANGTPAAGCGKPGAASCSDAFGAALLKVEAVIK
jgi:hypothetical protein